MNVKNVRNKNKIPHFSIPLFGSPPSENSYTYHLQCVSAWSLPKSLEVTEVHSISAATAPPEPFSSRWSPVIFILLNTVSLMVLDL